MYIDVIVADPAVVERHGIYTAAFGGYLSMINFLQAGGGGGHDSLTPLDPRLLYDN